MKNLMLIVLFLVSSIVISQDKPKLENVDDQVKATYCYENGNVKQVGYFIDGKLEGKWISYSEEGNVVAIAQYKNGKKHGKFNKCTDDGEPILLQTYDNDRLVEKKKLNDEK